MALENAKKRKIRIAVGLLLLALGLTVFVRPVFQAVRLGLLAGIIALLLSPLCVYLEKYMPAGLAAALSIFAAASIFVIALISVVMPLVSGIRRIYGLLPEFMERFHVFLSDISGNIDIFRLGDLPALNGASDFARRLVGGFASGAVDAFASAADVVIAAAVAWYMLVNRSQIALSAELIAPSAQRQTVLKGLAAARLEIMMYLRGQAIIALCVGVLASVALLVIGIPSAVTLGFTTGLLNMIPYFGPFIAAVPVGIIALTDGLLPAVLSVGALVAVQQIDGLLLSPRIVGSTTGFPPAVVMVSIFAAGTAWGVSGMLCVIPLMILIRTCVRVFVELGHNH